MASTRTVNNSEKQSGSASRPEDDIDLQTVFPRFGLLNGFLIGLALVLGLWGLEVVNLAGVPVPLQFPSLILGAILIVGLCTFTGWLTGRFESSLIILLFWLVTGVLITLIVAFQPTIGRTLTVWIADTRFWGLPIYPSFYEILTGPIIGGFFIILALGLLSILQNYRLESIAVEVDESGRLQRQGWLQLILPLPIVIIAGAVTASLFNDPSTKSLQLVHLAIPVVVNSEGDLFARGLEDALNYSAFNSVRDQLSLNYTLGLGEFEPVNSTTYVVIDFDNGAWATCRILNESLSFCFDAAPPYTLGLAHLLTGEELPDPCPGCLPQVDEELHSWLQDKGENFTGPPQIQREAQWGRYVLMRAETDDYALECWFNGISPVQLESCTEVLP